LEKTNENLIPLNRYSNLLQRSDIFNRIKQNNDIPKSGKRNISMENIRNDENYSGKRYRDMNEIHFMNLYNDKYRIFTFRNKIKLIKIFLYVKIKIFSSHLRNNLNPNINMKLEGKGSTNKKIEKTILNKYISNFQVCIGSKL